MTTHTAAAPSTVARNRLASTDTLAAVTHRIVHGGRRRRVMMLVASLLAVTACSADPLPPGDATRTESTGSGAGAESASGSGPDAVTVDAGQVLIDDAAPSTPFDRRLLGTNVPAWLGPELLTDPTFQAETIATGTTLLRMPGGSWSNSYDWKACELGDEAGCFWTWAARPTDFIDFMQATGIDGMWTVSINQTAQAAAAAVAFFNGSVDDETVIGTDRDGVEWGTVGFWAQLRTTGGNPDPVGIELWEVGNEVYGGAPASGGAECASFGWEDVWTCDGAEYVAGTADHDGYLQIREAMITVDPDIEVGAVGVGDPDSWTGWGSEVIDGSGDQLDFYVVHDYGFDQSPRPDAALARAEEIWPDTMSAVRERLAPDVPVAITEYNLVAFDSGDTDAVMASASNAFFIADTIGQLAVSGASIANQWNLANGTAPSGTDYGLIEVDDLSRRPQFAGFAAWRDAGTELYPASVGDERLHVYPTRHDDGRWSIVVLNLADEPLTTTFTFSDGAPVGPTSVRAAVAPDLTGATIDMVDDVAIDDDLTVALPANSITTIDISPADDGA